jgi:heat-inducible transcriptional repressor
MDARKSLILKAIIESFIDAADPVGSKYILQNYKLNISSATIRNDMAYLEEIGLIYQPHVSAGRVPTGKGFRMFVDELMDKIPQAVMEKQQALLDIQKEQKYKEMEMFLKDSISKLANATSNVSFITLPWKKDAYYLGISNVLKKPEFRDAIRASSIVEILEDKDRFLECLDQLELTRKVRVYIGEENIIPSIKSCSILLCSYNLDDEHAGIIGILGPTRMRYAYNISALECLRDDLEQMYKRLI